MDRLLKSLLCLLLVTLTWTQFAHGAVAVQTLGSSPGASVGPYAVTAFTLNAQSFPGDGAHVFLVVGGPGGTTLPLNPFGTKYTAGVTWLSWGNGYTGPVYFYQGGQVATIGAPALTRALYFYAQPTQSGSLSFTIQTDAGGSYTYSLPSLTRTGGASGVGFYTTAGEAITSVMVSSTDPTGFAFGQFGLFAGSALQPTAIPALNQIPALNHVALALLGLLMVAAVFMARRHELIRK